MSICVAGPEFLSPETCRRYLHLLPNFKNFVFSITNPTDREILVANEPIAAIRRAMREWVLSFFIGEHHPIPILSSFLPSFLPSLLTLQSSSTV
jgi:hypothetical protein